MKKIICGLTLFLASAGFAAKPQELAGGVVNFTQCILESKYGKEEQENFEKMRKQMLSMMEETEKDLKEVSQKLEDTEYRDSLSPKAEEELRSKQQALSEDLNRYQTQYYNAMNQVNFQIIQKLSSKIAKASEAVAKEKKFSTILNKEALFYFDPTLEITQQVIQEMDKEYDQEISNLSQNTQDKETNQGESVSQNQVEPTPESKQ